MAVCRRPQLPRRHRMFRVMGIVPWMVSGLPRIVPFSARSIMALFRPSFAGVRKSHGGLPVPAIAAQAPHVSRHGIVLRIVSGGLPATHCGFFARSAMALVRPPFAGVLHHAMLQMLSVLSSIKRRIQLFPFQQVECFLKGNMRPSAGVLMAKDIPKHTRLACRLGIKPACFSFLLKKAGVYGGKWIQQSRAIFTKSRPWLLRFCGCIRFHVEATPLSRETMGYACPLAQGKARGLASSPQCPGIPFYFKKARRTVSGSSGPSLFYGHLLSRKGCGTAMFQPGCAAKHASYFSCAAHASPFHPQGRHADHQARGRPALEVPLAKA